MKRKSEPLGLPLQNCLARIFVKSIGQRSIEEVAIISKATKGARYAAYSSIGRGLGAPVVRGH
jgi:hypothetical protein